MKNIVLESVLPLYDGGVNLGENPESLKEGGGGVCDTPDGRG